MSDNNNQWFTNKELYEQMTNMSKELLILRGEMSETRTLIKQYNGLREKIEGVERDSAAANDKVDSMIDRWQGRNNTWDNMRNWGGWVFGLISLLVLLYNQII